MAEKKGSVGFFSTYRPGVPIDIYSSPIPPTSHRDEMHMTDGVSYNYNARYVPPHSLMSVFKNNINDILKVSLHSERAIDGGKLMGMTFVSERSRGLEELYFAAIHYSGNEKKSVEIFKIADKLPMFNGTRMEDHGAFAGHYFIYVSTQDPALQNRQPWTAVFRVNLSNGKQDRMTPRDQADLSPAVSPSGKTVAVASFQDKRDSNGNLTGWDGDIDDLRTDICVMDVENPSERKLLIKNGGWPSWGSEDVLFFHRACNETDTDGKPFKRWKIFRAEIKGTFPILEDDTSGRVIQVTPTDIDCVTPSAINDTTVAVATIRKSSTFADTDRTVEQYRHIEIFNVADQESSVKITQNIKPLADHYNPFVIDGGNRVGYQRCNTGGLEGEEDGTPIFDKLHSPEPELGVFRVAGVFPTFTKDGSKFAFVDNEFQNVYVVDSHDWNTLRIVYKGGSTNSVFAPMWSENPSKDILYVCMGPSFSANDELNICAIHNVLSNNPSAPFKLTNGYNNAFPSTNPQGTRMVFRSTRCKEDGEEYAKSKNLYIMDNVDTMDSGERKVTRVSKGAWTDTHCQWSPRGDWIVFSSTRDKPSDAPPSDHGLDPGYFVVYLMLVEDPAVVVRVMGSGNDLSGHMNHPFFHADATALVVAADLAAVSADPMSMTLFLHSVRPYGDVFTIDLDNTDIHKNKDLTEYKRITHSRYENSTVTWTVYSPPPGIQMVKLRSRQPSAVHYHPQCPFIRPNGGEDWNMTGQIIIPNRRC